MTDREARRDALATWVLEFSVLWAVFPLLDQLVGRRPIDAWLMALSLAISLTTLLHGVILKRGNAHEWRDRHRACNHSVFIA
jgi:hypothetical protein